MKKLFVLAFAAAAMMSVKAESYLYWMVGDGAPAFSYASLYVDKGAGGIVAIDEYVTGVAEGSTQTSLLPTASEIAASSLGAGYNYYVELLNANGEATYRSGLLGYSDISSYVYTAPNPPPSGAVNMGGTGSYTAIPEPTSGLMMLVGFALLGLKRKRA